MAELTDAQIGKNAASMLQKALIAKIESSGLELSDDPEERFSKAGKRLTPLKHSKVYVRRFRDKETKKMRLRGLAIHMGVHGFYQNFGGESYKKTHDVLSKKQKTFRRKGSRMFLKRNDFLGKAIQSSGVIPYLSSVLPEQYSKNIVSVVKSVGDE